MTQALAGLRVIDLSTGPAAGIATMVLADFGAEVIRIGRPGGALLDDLAAAPMWLRGKHALLLDLDTEAGRAKFDVLLTEADVLVTNWRTSALSRRGLEPRRLRERYPALVVAHVTGFGDRGPYADLPGYEHLVAARAGRMRLFSGIVDREGPVFSALQVGVHACAQSTLSGILAALHARTLDGRGALVRTSILQGLLSYDQWALLLEQFRPRYPDAFPPVPPPSALPPLPTLHYHPAQAGDGRWLQFGNLLPHLFDNFLRVTDLLDVLIDPEFDPAQMLIRDPERHEAFRLQMLERVQTRSAAEWMTDFIADGGIVAAPYQTTQEALNDPDIIANGHVIEREDGGVQIGPLARLTVTPAAPGAPMQTDGERLAALWLAAARGSTSAPTGDRSTLPLAGLKVVEIATIIAAPMGACGLADMGAHVIKIEQVGGDPYRGLQSGLGAARVNAGKESISLDLKKPEAREIVLRLCADADVLIHNYRPGVPERLGIGYEQIAAVNPRIVYIQANGYGPDGPGAQRPSTHPVPGAALGGVLYHLGERVPTDVLPAEEVRTWTRRLMCANEVNPDPNTAVVITSAALLGIVTRDRTGIAQRIIVDMFGANAWANHDDFLLYPGKAPRLRADAQLQGLGPTYRLYRAAEGQWLFVAAVTEAERVRLAATLEATGVGLSADLRSRLVAVTAGNLGQEDELAHAFTELFATRTADAWEALFVPAGVGCVRADGPYPGQYWLTDAQPRAMGLTTPAMHPIWGAYERHGRQVLFDAGDQPLGDPPLPGQHNRTVLTRLGYSDDTVSALRASGVTWADPLCG